MPSKLQFILAYADPVPPLVGIFLVTGGVLLNDIPILLDGADIWTDFHFLLRFLASIPLGLAAGWIFMGIWLDNIRCRINGFPFHKDDKVFILRGRHKGRVTTVYQESWGQFGAGVRLRLGDQAARDETDVYSPSSDICRTDLPISE